MHAWVTKFGAYISKQLAFSDNAKRESLCIIHALKERYGISSIDNVIKHLSVFSFGNIAQLANLDGNYVNDITKGINRINKDQTLMKNLQPTTKDDTSMFLLICKIIPNEKAKNGSTCLQDPSGQLTCIVDNLDMPCTSYGVLLLKWQLISYRNMKCKFDVKKERLQYVEIYDYIPCFSNKEEETLLMLPTYHRVSEYLMLHKKDKGVNLEGVVLTKSPVHKTAGSNPFYFLRLACTLHESHTAVVVVQGSDKVHWSNFTTIGSYVKFAELHLSIVNKGSVDERKVLCTTKNSKMTKIKSNIVCKIDDKLINYMGWVTSCEDAEYGLYCLDGKIKLLCSHQPSITLQQGLRVGARVHVMNVHNFQWKNQTVLFCCTVSSVEILKLSETSSPLVPFIAQLHPLASKCQQLKVEEYLWLIDSVKRVVQSIWKRYLSSKEYEWICTALYNLFNFKGRCVNRSVFTEFIDLPHKCIFHQTLVPRNLPAFESIKGIISLMDSTSVTEWLNGREFDHCPDAEDLKWQYSLYEHSNVVFCGRVQHDQFSYKLYNDQEFVRLISTPKVAEERMLLLKKFKIVVEKFTFYETNSRNKERQEKTFYKRYLLIDESDFTVIPSEDEKNVVHPVTKKLKLADKPDESDSRTCISDLKNVLTSENQPLGRCRVELKCVDCAFRCWHSLEGIVISREIKRPRSQNYDVESHPNDIIYVPSIGKVKLSTVIKENMSFYPFTTSVLIVRIVDRLSKDIVSVYFDSNKFKYPIGLLPGASVKFNRVEKIKSQTGSCYFKMNLSSTMEITCLPPPSFHELKHHLGRILEELHQCTAEHHVISFYQTDQSLTPKFYILARVVLVQSAFAKWKCGRCFYDVIDGQCRHSCQNKHHFTMEMRCVIDDGTAEGYMNIENDNVREILNLSSLEYDQIRAASRSVGCISYQRSLGEHVVSIPKKTECELLLQKKIFANSLYRYRRFYCKCIPRKSSTEQKNSIIVCGLTEYQTLCPPKVSFQCISFTDVKFGSYNKNKLLGEEIENFPDQRHEETVYQQTGD